ncbi:MAG: glycosyltransferase [Oscillochloris sp.]|nr:glycosyltransferase [Oscillochloris sp.]
MNILLLSPYPPYPPRGGGALRIFHLLRGLAARHEVTLLSFAPDAAAVAGMTPLRDFCRLATVIGPPPRPMLARAFTTLASPLPDMALRNADPQYAEALSRILAAQRFDLVQAESIEMAGYGLMSRSFAPPNQAPRSILDQFNAEYVLQRRAAYTDLRRGLALRPRALLGGIYSLIQWRKLAAYERRMLRSYDWMLVVSDEDRRALRRLDRRAEPLVIPNGVDAAHYRPGTVTPIDFGGPAIVFTGTFDFRPNIDAINWCVRKVLPLVRARRPDARLVLVGRGATAAVRALHNGVAVDLVGEVPDVRPYIAGAAVFAVPLRIGGGSRLKLLEALAAAAPVVSTTMGAEGIDGLGHERHLLLADRPADFAAAILRLLDDPALGRRLGAAGRTHVAAQYDWNAIIPRLEQTITMSPSAKNHP